jgi:tetratricopeptide (TPR) repeat protein
MQSIKISSILTIFVLIIFILSQCGSNPAEEGEQAFQKGNYNLAIKHFLEARKQDPSNNILNEKIALAYMYRGEELFSKTKNIKSFSGNFEKSNDFIPENPSVEFKENYSKILYSLAKGYNDSNPQNDIEKEEFLNKSITYLEEATFQDESNSQAAELLEQIKTENFQKMLDKGKDFHNKARKQGKNDLYFTAEYYYKKAAYFDIHNEEAKKLLSKTRGKTLSILNIQEDLAIAIADYAWE